MERRKYGKWEPQTMLKAVNEFQGGKIGFNECCRKYDIPKPTFKRHLMNKVKRGTVRSHLLSVNGRETALPLKLEDDLVAHILKCEEYCFGLTITDVRKLAFQILEANPHLPNRFNKDIKMASKKWYYSFMKRHPNLRLRQAESISIARTKGFNRDNVNAFFDILERIVDENSIDAAHTFNVDETGFCTVQKKSPRVIAHRGKHHVGFLSSGERGVNTTAVCCTSAAGNYVPPMIIFKRKRKHPALAVGAPFGSLVEVSDTGYINSELFVKWLKHFINYIKPTPARKVLLLLDGHTTHSKNLEAILLARDNGVVMLQLPGHTSHRLQPLDVAIFKPLKTFYDQAIAKWLRSNPGNKITQFEIASIFTEAYGKTASISNATSGFRVTGIWPVDRSVFSEHDFTLIENFSCEIPNSQSKPSASFDERKKNSSINAVDNTVSSVIVRIPLSKIKHFSNHRTSVQKNNRNVQKTVVLTSSSYKRNLEISKRVQAKRNLRTKSGRSKNIDM